MYLNPREIHGGVVWVSNNYASCVLPPITVSKAFIDSIGVETTVYTQKYLFVQWDFHEF